MITLCFFAMLACAVKAQNSDNNKTFDKVICEYSIPTSRNGLSVTSFWVTPKIYLDRSSTSSTIILEIRRTQGTAQNTDPSFKYSYNYNGKQYGNESVGYDAFNNITASTITYEVLVTYGSKSWGWSKVDGMTNHFGPIDRDAKASDINVRVRVVGISSFNGTSVIENKIRALIAAKTASESAQNTIPKTTTSQATSSQPNTFAKGKINPNPNNGVVSYNNVPSTGNQSRTSTQNNTQTTGTVPATNSHSNAIAKGKINPNPNNGVASYNNMPKAITSSGISNRPGLSEKVSVNGSEVQVYQKGGKFYMVNSDGSQLETSKTAFDKVTTVSDNKRARATTTPTPAPQVPSIPSSSYLITNFGNNDAEIAAKAAKIEVYTQAAVAVIGLFAKSPERIAQEESEAEASRLRDEQARSRRVELENLKAERVRLIANRKDLLAFYANGKHPLSSLASNIKQVYFFAYQFIDADLDGDAPTIKLTDVFASKRYDDDTWLFKSTLADQVSKANGGQKFILAGYYLTEDEALQKQQELLSQGRQLQIKVTMLPYSSKAPISNTKENLDFWGAPVGDASAGASTTKKQGGDAKKTPPKKAPAAKVDFWGNPIKN